MTNKAHEPVEILLNRLQNVHQYGQGWRATCPVHDGKSNSSLSIAVGDSGHVLIHCFGGCEPEEILSVCGLEMADLFPKRITQYTTPAERRELRELARQSQWKAAIPALYTEALVVLMAAGKINSGEPLSPADDERLMLAIENIESAKGVFCGR
jgi:hypothetical protein